MSWGFEQLAVRHAAVRHAAAERERGGEWIGSVVALKFALAVPVIPLILVIVFLLSDSNEMRATAVIASALMLTGALSAARGVFQIRVRNDVNVVILTINSVLWTLAVIALARADGSMVAFALAFLAVAVTSTGIQFVWAIRTQPLHLRGDPALARAVARRDPAGDRRFSDSGLCPHRRDPRLPDRR